MASNYDETISVMRKSLNDAKRNLNKSKQETEYWRKQATHNYAAIKNDVAKFQYMTGLPHPDVFDWILSLIMDKVTLTCKQMTHESHLLLVLMKIRLGVTNKDLAYRFRINYGMVSKIYRSWLVILSKALQPLIVWHSRCVLRQHFPSAFKSYKNCACIIDCTEIFIERSLNLEARAISWSNYKHTNTIKYLIGISPAGAVTFLSPGWGGRTSDKQLTIESGVLDFLIFGDSILADKGFLIAGEVAARGAVLAIPSFTRGKSQMPAKDVDQSRKIAHVRIHVERVIGRLKTFKILNSTIPISQVDLLNDVMIVALVVCNNESVVSK